MNNTHVPPSDQPVQIGDCGGEYDELKCVGYYVSERPSPGYPYNQHYVWWEDGSQDSLGWYMQNPTNKGIIRVSDFLDIKPLFE